MKSSREELMVSLARLKPALASGGVVPELSHVWFDGSCAQAYDGGFGIKLDLKTDLDCGIPGAALLGLLDTSALDQVTLEPNGAALQVKLGKSNSKLAILEANRKVWPFPLKLPRNAEPLALGEDFIEGLRKTLFIKASPATRVEHHGVMVQVNKNNLELYSTDSATMARAIIKGAAKGAPFERTLLPRDFAEQLVAQSPEGVKLYVLDDCLIAEAEGISFYSNVLDISGADDMSGIMAKNMTKHPDAVPLPPGLDGALSRAEILSGKEDAALEIAVDGDTLKLTGTYALGAVNESLILEGKPPAAKLRVRAELLRRALAHVESFSLTKDSLLLRGEPDFVYLVASL